MEPGGQRLCQRNLLSVLDHVHQHLQATHWQGTHDVYQSGAGCSPVPKWLKHAILEQPDCAAHMPQYIGEDHDKRSPWDDDLEKMTFKAHAALPPAMTNLPERPSDEDKGHRGARATRIRPP